MNCCLHYMLHINLHISYIYFIKLNLNLKEFQASNNFSKVIKKTGLNIWMNYIQIETTFEFEYQTRFSREFIIQYITMLFTYKHN